ncbi:hypothetical protein AKO1_007943 [Acrasis kona]|uniref:Uncharacterized protein n=1 Tax=Acrasis kona TaxID=1008807 RepID=A0AAW2YNX5_9EUKA
MDPIARPKVLPHSLLKVPTNIGRFQGNSPNATLSPISDKLWKQKHPLNYQKKAPGSTLNNEKPLRTSNLNTVQTTSVTTTVQPRQ